MHSSKCLFAGQQLVLETLYALTSSTKIIKEAMAKGNMHLAFSSDHVHCDDNLSGFVQSGNVEVFGRLILLKTIKLCLVKAKMKMIFNDQVYV